MRSMITRFVILVLIAVLALPVTTLTRPGDTHQSPWSDVAVAAKGKKHKKKDKPKFTTVTRTVRQPVTQTFTSGTPVTIPIGAPNVFQGPANPYPSTIAVSGFSNGTITDVNLILDGFTHTCPRDVDVLLSRNDGRRALVMSDVGSGGGCDDAENIDLTLDDEAGTPLPVPAPFVPLVSGTFQPANHSQVVGDTADPFFAPAPAPDGSVALSTFDGADPNGTWQVWVMDDTSGDVGDLAGWALEITAEADIQVQERVQINKDKKGKKKGRGRR